MVAIGTLTGGIAHDYNNLLSIIMGNLSLAKEEAAPGSELSVFLGEIGGASEKLRNLTHELMALARGGAPVKKLGPLTELFGIASEVVPAEGGILLEESISKDLWHVPHDSHKMRSVLGNVLSNAVEAMPHGGTLSIAAKNLRVDDEPADIRLQSMKNGDYVLITIKDQGKGIPKEHLSKIFDPYFSTKAMGVQKGMGLGLATSYAIVQKHGGHITVDSAPGEGTTVKIYLPAQSKPAKIDVKTPTEDNGAFPVRRVLVMDDEEMLRNLAEKMLEKLGFVVETVKDGQEAIEACRKQKGLGEPFDAAILDLTIKGGMGGEQAIGELLKIDPKIKAIVSSGYFNDPVMSDFQKWGFVGAMAKPYEKKTLKELLESILG